MAKRTVSNGKNHSSLRENKSRISDAEADKILEDFKSRKPVMTKKRMLEYENAIRHSNNCDNFGVSRRMALAVLTRPCKGLMDDIKNSRDAAVALAHAQGGIADYSKLLNELFELLNEAQRRLTVALCGRPDAGEVFEEAKRQRTVEVSHG